MSRPSSRPAAGGLAAALACALAAGCGGEDGRPARPYEERLDAVWADFDRTYPYFAEKGVDWAAQRELYLPQAAAASSEADLAAVLLELLGDLRDQHVGLVDPRGRWYASYAPAVQANQSAAVTAAYGARWGLVTAGNWAHGLAGDVPYLLVTSWSGPLAGLDAFLESVRDAPGVIIDVRANGGGNNAYALALASRFADEARVFAWVKYRDGPAHDDFGAPQAATIAPGGPWQLTCPVLVLVGPGALSSSEDFAAAMRELPGVTLVGAPTGGASANPASRPLEGGWSYTVSRWHFTTADGIVVEGHGVPPDVEVPVTQDDLAAGRDPVLDWAEAWAAERAAAARRAR